MWSLIHRLYWELQWIFWHTPHFQSRQLTGILNTYEWTLFKWKSKHIMLSFIGISGKCMKYVEFHLTHQSLLESVKNCCFSYTTNSLSLVSINSSQTQMWKKPDSQHSILWFNIIPRSEILILHKLAVWTCETVSSWEFKGLRLGARPTPSDLPTGD